MLWGGGGGGWQGRTAVYVKTFCGPFRDRYHTVVCLCEGRAGEKRWEGNIIGVSASDLTFRCDLVDPDDR